MDTGIKVGDLMTKEPVTVSHNTSLQECARIMAKEHVGSLLVTKNKKLVGVVTEQDIVRKAVIKNLSAKNNPISKVMETKLITVSPSLDIFEALKKMSKFNIRHLPVMHKGAMVGFITTKDILKVQPELFDILQDKIEIRQQEQRDYFTE